MIYKAIIFDMDGTIVDTEIIWDSATRLLIESKGASVTPELLSTIHDKIRGLALHKSCAIIKDMLAIDDSVGQLIEEKMSFARALYAEGISFIPGFSDFHQQVKSHNLKSGIATNANDWTLQTTNYALGLDSFFGEHMYGISCVNQVCKPDPAIYAYVAAQLDVEPTACIAVEDSAHGIAAAKRAGMFCIGINTGKNRALLHEADHVVEGYADINLTQILG